MITQLRTIRQKLVLFTLNLAALASGQALASSITLAWDPNPEPVVEGYTVYVGSVPGVYHIQQNVGANSQATIDNLVTGQTYYVAVLAYSSDGLESPLSQEISFVASGPQVTLPEISTMRITSENGVATLTLTVSSPVGTTGQVQYSTDLVNWMLLEEFSDSNGPLDVTDPSFGVDPHRFYRVAYEDNP